MTIAEARKTKKMYVVDKVLNGKPGYNGFYETERIYEKNISFTAKEAFQVQKNKLKTRSGMHKDAMEKAYHEEYLLDKYSATYKE